MSKLIDITGQRFGKLIVLERAENSKDGKARWLCQCDCGNQKIILGTHLRRGKILSCGCYGHQKTSSMFLDDLTGKVFDKLTVLERIPGTCKGKVKWKCQCECGSIIEVYADALRSGHTRSCGCTKSYGEEKISKLLTDNNISFIKQYTFPDCCINKNNYKTILKFDFAILNNQNQLQYLIEYDGIQHFKSMDCGWNNQQHLQDLQQRDQIKNNYCLIHHIPLIRIPYIIYDKLTIEDLLENSKYILAAKPQWNGELPGTMLGENTSIMLTLDENEE